jgi:hypothetical protein
MSTADNTGYINDAYEKQRQLQSNLDKRTQWVHWLECAAFAMAFICLIGYMQMRDVTHKNKEIAAENARLKTPGNMTCLYQYDNVLMQHPNCTIINAQYARIGK